jgi:hypothetical protein
MKEETPGVTRNDCYTCKHQHSGAGICVGRGCMVTTGVESGRKAMVNFTRRGWEPKTDRHKTFPVTK